MAIQGASQESPNGMSHAQKVDRLVDLARELAKRGIRIELSDARPALSVRLSLTASRVSVEVVAGAFVWRRDGYERHDAEDQVGAADRIVDHLKARHRDGSA